MGELFFSENFIISDSMAGLRLGQIALILCSNVALGLAKTARILNSGVT